MRADGSTVCVGGVDCLKVVPLRHALPSIKGRFAGLASAPVSVAMMGEAIAAEVLARHATHPNTQRATLNAPSAVGRARWALFDGVC